MRRGTPTPEDVAGMEAALRLATSADGAGGGARGGRIDAGMGKSLPRHITRRSSGTTPPRMPNCWSSSARWRCSRPTAWSRRPSMSRWSPAPSAPGRSSWPKWGESFSGRWTIGWAWPGRSMTCSATRGRTIGPKSTAGMMEEECKSSPEAVLPGETMSRHRDGSRRRRISPGGGRRPCHRIFRTTLFLIPVVGGIGCAAGHQAAPPAMPPEPVVDQTYTIPRGEAARAYLLEGAIYRAELDGPDIRLLVSPTEGGVQYPLVDLSHQSGFQPYVGLHHHPPRRRRIRVPESGRRAGAAGYAPPGPAVTPCHP